MIDDFEQPHRPLFLGQHYYQSIKQKEPHSTQVITQSEKKEFFSLIITTATTKGTPMDERQFLIDLVFKPIEPNLKLRPEETQLLLSYIGEILKEIEEEKAITDVEKITDGTGSETCNI
jgi:hypothetical protein